MFDHKTRYVRMLRYVYILDIDNRGKKSKHFGRYNCFYTGQTNSLPHRLIQHISGRNKFGKKSGFLHKNYRDARKTLVYVAYVIGTEWDAEQLEQTIKPKTRAQKHKLIASDSNQLVNYIPLKAIILKRYKKPDEQIALYMK